MEVELSNTLTAYVMHHIESHLGKEQPQAKIVIVFLFGQLHFNDVSSHALFYGGHLVMRSAKPGNHLKRGIGLIESQRK